MIEYNLCINMLTALNKKNKKLYIIYIYYYCFPLLIIGKIEINFSNKKIINSTIYGESSK